MNALHAKRILIYLEGNYMQDLSLERLADKVFKKYTGVTPGVYREDGEMR